jgi:hypothetical protein
MAGIGVAVPTATLIENAASIISSLAAQVTAPPPSTSTELPYAQDIFYDEGIPVSALIEVPNGILALLAATTPTASVLPRK